MSELDQIRSDLEPGTSDELVMLAVRLRDERPCPSPAFRGELGRRLRARGEPRLSVGRARALVAAYATSGTILLVIGSVSAAGLGPLS